MFGLCFKRLQFPVPSCSIGVVDFHCFQIGPLFIRSWSSKPSILGSELDVDESQGRRFTVSYLVNTLGFSPERAISVTKADSWAKYCTQEKADSAIKLLKHYGLSEPSIVEILQKRPDLLNLSAQKTLMPKLEFFASVGISGTVLDRFLCLNPGIMKSSLERSIRPCYDIIKSLSIPLEKLPYCFKNMFWNRIKVLDSVPRNVVILRAHGVPDSSFHIWDPVYLVALTLDSDKAKENVRKVMSMGIDPSCAIFMKALYVVSVTDATKWERKMKFYRKWGFTEHDILLAFRKVPMFMCYGEKTVSRKLDFYMNVMDLQPSNLAGYPEVLSYSLEKRIIPRCSVIRVLQLQGLIAKEHVSINTILQRGEKWFLESFVIKYQEQVPELLSIFQGKIGLAELGLGIVKSYEVKQQ